MFVNFIHCDVFIHVWWMVGDLGRGLISWGLGGVVEVILRFDLGIFGFLRLEF
jgi:hypothetical protein